MSGQGTNLYVRMYVCIYVCTYGWTWVLGRKVAWLIVADRQEWRRQCVDGRVHADHPHAAGAAAQGDRSVGQACCAHVRAPLMSTQGDKQWTEMWSTAVGTYWFHLRTGDTTLADPHAEQRRESLVPK